MSFLSGLFNRKGRPDSRETLAKELVTKDNLFTKTDIPNALPIAVADVVGLALGDKETRIRVLKEINPEYKGDGSLENLLPGEVLTMILYYFRINRISFNRQSRSEFVEALRETGFGDEQAINKMDKLLGRHT